jgi:hypothetical protein
VHDTCAGIHPFCSHTCTLSAGPAELHPRFALLFCGTQFGWAAQLPQLFPQHRGSGSDDATLAAPCVEEVLRVPSFHVFGAEDPFKPTVRPLLTWQAGAGDAC